VGSPTNTFVLTIKNVGGPTAAGFTDVNVLDIWETPCFEFASYQVINSTVSPAPTISQNGNSLEVFLANLSPGEEVQIQVTMNRFYEDCANCENTLKVESFVGYDINPNNNSATATDLAEPTSYDFVFNNPHSDVVSNAQTLSGTIFIGDFTTFIADGSSATSVLTIQNADITLGEGAILTMKPGTSLTLSNCVLHGCDKMWDRILVPYGSTLLAENCTIQDAQYAVYPLTSTNIYPSAVVTLQNNTFQNNLISVFSDVAFGDFPVFTNWAANTFEGTGTLLPPFTGQTTHQNNEDAPYAGIELRGGQYFFKGQFFQRMINGIVSEATQLEVFNCRFVNISRGTNPNNFYSGFAHNGSAISVRSTYAWFGNSNGGLSLTGFGMTGAVPIVANFCDYGVYAERANVLVQHCMMNTLRTGIRINNAFFHTVNIHHNSLTSALNDIDLVNTEYALQMDIRHNLFQNWGNNWVRRGINVSDMGWGASPNLYIFDNEFSLDEGAVGIQLMNTRQAVIASNQFHINTDGIGIHLLNASENDISCNTTDAPLGGGIGYFTFRSPTNRFYCNTADHTSTGFFFSDQCPDTEFFGNQMIDNHSTGLYLGPISPIFTYATRIGNQTSSFVVPNTLASGNRGNQWTGPFGLAAARHEDAYIAGNFGSVGFSPIGIDATMPYNLFPQPDIQPVTNWFVPATNALTNRFECNNNNNNFSCGNYQKPAHENQSDADQQIAMGTLYDEMYEPESKWLAEQALYKKLLENDSLLNGDSLMQVFFANKSQEAVGQLIQVDEADNTLLDSLQRISIINYQSQINTAMQQLRLNDSTIQAGTTPQDSLLRYNQNLQLKADIVQWNMLKTNALSNLETAHSQKVEDSRLLNQSVVTIALMEANEKTIHNLYLGKYLKGIAFTEEDKAEIIAIATQCPVYGGNGVFKARTLYHTWNDSVRYDDDSVCMYTAANMRRAKKPNTPIKAVVKSSFVKVYPNPADNKIMFELSEVAKQNYQIIVYSNLGREVQRLEIGENVRWTSLITDKFPEGIYYYTLRNATQQIESGKFVVQH
ncbi:MAG: T9SS type A sorting domain-containing protein, partial [Bacteroidia bacterium]